MRPRSNGCRVCVSRRIRCDLTRPSCMRCVSAGRECDGYPSVFVMQNPVTRKKATGKEAASSSAAAAAAAATAAGEAVPSTVSKSYLQMSQDVGLQTSNVPTIPTGPLRNYTEDVFCKFFLDSYFSFGTWNSEIQNNRQWVYEILQAPSKHTVSLPALRCLITGFFGKAQHDVELQARAGKMYSEAMMVLKRGLEGEMEEGSASRPFPAFQYLCATILLLQYEYLAFTAAEGWIQHSSGLEALVKVRGPRYFRRVGSNQRALLRWAKMPLHMENLRACKKSFLNLDEWQAIFNDKGKKRAQSDSLSDSASTDGDEEPESSIDPGTDITDIASGMPAVMEEVIDLKRAELNGEDRQDNLKRVTECREAVIKIQDDLRQWWKLRSRDYTQVPVATAVDVSDASVSTLSGTFLSFASLTATHNFCRYHAYHILILIFMGRLDSLFPEDGSVPEPFAPIPTLSVYKSTDHPNFVQGLSHARSICDALPMYTLPQYQYIGGLWAGFPTRMAWQAFPPGSKESVWLESFLAKISDTSGFELNRHLCRSL